MRFVSILTQSDDKLSHCRLLIIPLDGNFFEKNGLVETKDVQWSRRRIAE